MWKCPICSNEEKSEYICQKCGYDMRTDFVRSKTLCPVPDIDIQERMKLISAEEKNQQSRCQPESYVYDDLKMDTFSVDGTEYSMHNEILTLPYVIEFKDTFEDVYEKLLELADVMPVLSSSDIWGTDMLVVSEDSLVEGDICMKYDRYILPWFFVNQNEVDEF